MFISTLCFFSKVSLIKYSLDITYLKESAYLQESAYLCSMMLDEMISKEECNQSLRNIGDAFYVLNGRWKLPIILSLLQQSKRFNEIQKDMDGISPKVLAKELKDLEENGFIKRMVYSTTPVNIMYESTEYGLTLKNVLRELSIWGEQHRERIKQSMRKEFESQ